MQSSDGPLVSCTSGQNYKYVHAIFSYPSTKRLTKWILSRLAKQITSNLYIRSCLSGLQTSNSPITGIQTCMVDSMVTMALIPELENLYSSCEIFAVA